MNAKHGKRMQQTDAQAFQRHEAMTAHRRWKEYRQILADSRAGPEELARFDRVTRRDFLTAASRAAAFALVLFGAGPQAAARGLFGRGMIPSAWENIPDRGLPKPHMIVHSEDPFNGELPAHLLDDAVTPTARHFVRNNGAIPERARSKRLHGWALRVDGEVRHELALTLEDLLCYPQVTAQVVLECAGNGRSLFHPPVGGTQWIRGAVACSEWDRACGCATCWSRPGSGTAPSMPPATAKTPLRTAASRSRAAFRSPRRWTSTP